MSSWKLLKRSKKIKPVSTLDVVGRIASITAALPAIPWIKPITKDFGLKNGNSDRKG